MAAHRRTEDGTIICFLPGKAEIREAYKQLCEKNLQA